jgi:hypothetical protein
LLIASVRVVMDLAGRFIVGGEGFSVAIKSLILLLAGIIRLRRSRGY